MKGEDQYMVGSTTLPPNIDGQLRHHVILEIPLMKWIGKPASFKVCVSVNWWGEEGNGTIFRPPFSASKKVSKKFTRAVYGITSGPKKFKKYLEDMKVMQLNVINENNMSLLGQAHIPNLSTLLPSHPLSGTYPVLDNHSKKIAEVDVLISIKALQVRGNNEIPTPDEGLVPVERSNLFLNDLEVNNKSRSKSLHYASENYSLEPGDINVHTVDSNKSGVVDFFVNSLETLMHEMDTSCSKVDIRGIAEVHQSFLPSRVSSLQPSGLAWNSIPDAPSSQMRSLDDLELLENDELFELLYQDISGSEKQEDVEVTESKKSSEKNVQEHLNEHKEVMKNLPSKVKKDLSQATGILLLVSNFSYTVTSKQHVWDARSGRTIQSDYTLSMYVCKSHDAGQEHVAKMNPLAIKSRGQVLQFNRKVVLDRSTLDLEVDDVSRILICFKLLERASGLKLKLTGFGKLYLHELILKGHGGPLKVNLNDKTGILIGSVEIKMKMLFKGGEKLGYSFDDEDDVKDSNEAKSHPPSKQASKKSEANDIQFHADVPMYAFLEVLQGQIFKIDKTLKGPVSSSSDAGDVALVVRTHWSDGLVAKGTAIGAGDGGAKVSFRLVQIHPVSLSSTFLSKMRNNYIVIEVWINAEQKLLGISKLPVNAFFDAFNNKESYQSAKNDAYPVVASDGDFPILSPASGNSVGMLQVLLSMGSYSQILHLQDFRSKMSLEIPQDSFQRLPSNSLNRLESTDSRLVHHKLEISLESLVGMSEMMKDGEEYFVEFNFPKLQEGNFKLSRHRTSSATTDGGGELAFRESFLQMITLPDNVPLYWHICKAYSANKLPNQIEFHLWSRSLFHGTSALIAKGVITIKELYGTLDLKAPHSPKASSEFFVKFFRSSSHGSDELFAGALKVVIDHSSSVKQNGEDVLYKTNLPVQHASLAIGISKTCGLRHAVQKCLHVFHHKRNFQTSFATFVEVSLSLLDQINTKVTRVVEKTFTPDFGTNFEFLVPLLWNHCLTIDEKSAFLSEVFEEASLDIKVYCFNNDDSKASPSNNILIGKVKVFLSSLLEKHTGLRGWFPIESPRDDLRSDAAEERSPRHVGGIEVDVRLSPNDSLDMILEACRLAKWSPRMHSSFDTLKRYSIQLKIDQLVFSKESLSVLGPNPVKYCYITYKFFDKGDMFSEICPVSLWRETYQAGINHIRDLQINSSPGFSWYLSEEKLEIQVWVSDGKYEERPLPHVNDEYVGSGFICLSKLAQFNEGNSISSGYCPLFNAGSEHLGSAFLHYSLVMRTLGSEAEQQNGDAPQKDHKNVMTSASEEENLFLARVLIERAYHLTAIYENGIQIPPSAYVTFQASRSFEKTGAVGGDYDPIWNHEADVWLSKELLSGDENYMILKVWHKIEGKAQDDQFDRYLGFASIDLKPLLTKEFQTVSGFYNVNNFNGFQQGQVKVSITPLQKVHLTTPQLGESKADNRFIGDLTEFVTKDITEALEALTTGLKQKMSQNFDLNWSSMFEANHKHDTPRNIEDTPTNIENTSVGRKSPRYPDTREDQREFPIISMLNCASGCHECEYHNNTECTCHHSPDSTTCCSTPKGENVAVMEPQSHRTSPELNVQDHDDLPRANNNNHFGEKYTDSEAPRPSSDMSFHDIQSNSGAVEMMQPENIRSVPSSEQTSEDELSARRNALVEDWLSEHKRKVSERIVAFKSFKLPSFEQSQKLAKIVAAKHQET